jgi:ATP-dependent helicase HrpB
MKHFQPSLPIDSVLHELSSAFSAATSVVLSAAPGAGKTTRVPLALMDEQWLGGKKIIMLEPRRLAARRAAERMSMSLGEKVGNTVGYRIRGDAVVGKATRIEVVTEGILTRMLQHSPDLPDVGLVIFDEFHERSINADLGLALALDVQRHLRNDVRILVMSATLDVDAVSIVLGNSPIIKCEGRNFPVETIYAKFPSDKAAEVRTTETILRALENQEGDLLIFLPGRKEIRRVEQLLYEQQLPEEVAVHSLYGDASYQQQTAALSPAQNGQRKIILSTSIAETSLTIDGVRVVIDSGLARSALFDPRRGMTGLVTVPVSKAVADQRRGRAGRQQAGICYRLWMESEHEQLPDYPQPEIKVADLAQLALDFALWGTPNGENLNFLDPPPVPHLQQARTLLRQLDAIDDAGKLTPHGKLMSALPVHPRIANMLLRGKELGIGTMACDVAALLEERTGASPNSDINLTEQLYGIAHRKKSDLNSDERVAMQSRRLRQMLDVRNEYSADETASAGILLALAYPERVARRRSQKDSRYLMAGGQTAVLPKGSLLAREEFLAIGEVDDANNDARAFLAAPLERSQIEKVFADDLLEKDEIRWNEKDRSVLARHVVTFGAVVLSEQSIEPHGEIILFAMIGGIRQMGIECLPWNKEAHVLQQRVQWLKKKSGTRDDFPDFSDTSLLASLEAWLAPFLDGIRRADQLQQLNLPEILQSRFTPQQWKDLERLAPSHLNLPSGSHMAVDYSTEQPVLAVRLQELFGQIETPKILGGKAKVQIHLLSPAHRPLAVTQDLHSFWTNTYPEIRTQMRARYPRHVWPDDPLTATPTNKTKRHSR